MPANKKNKMILTKVIDEDDDADDTYGLCSVTVARQPVTLEAGSISHTIRQNKIKK